MTERRFVLLSEPRSGSNLLAGLLSSHPHIICAGELFNPSEEVRAKSHASPYSPEQEPVLYLSNVVFDRTETTISSGFRLFYRHARDARQSAIWAWLRDERIPIIHLVRRNLLHRAVSEQIANATGEWVKLPWEKTASENEAPVPVTIDMPQCLEQMHASAWFHDERHNYFSESPRLTVYYEDLCTNPVLETDRVQAFLGQDRYALTVQTIRQGNAPLSARVANFEALRHCAEQAADRGALPRAWLDFFDALPLPAVE